MNKLVLASASIGRKGLFEKYFTAFDIAVSEVDESTVKAETPQELTTVLALLKGKKVSESRPDDFVLGFDTVVVCEGQILGKPADLDEARKVLRFLSGKHQSVLSGYSLIHKNLGLELSGHSETILYFHELSESFIEEYVNTHPVTRFAGGYGLQDKDDLVEIHSGDRDTVIGAPMGLVIKALKDHGAEPGYFR